MEYIFEDDVGGELGSEVEAYCQKCRTEGPHTVITRYEDEVRQVQCGTCGHVHVFKPARPEPAEDEPPEVAAGGSKRRQVKKLNWEEAMRHPANAKAKAYGFRDAYRQGDYLDHPKFGRGYVNEVVDDTKLEAIFKDGPRLLVHNRKDLTEVAKTKTAGRGEKVASTGQPAKSPKAAKPAPPAKPASRAAKALEKPKVKVKAKAKAKVKAKVKAKAKQPVRSRGSRR